MLIWTNLHWWSFRHNTFQDWTASLVSKALQKPRRFVAPNAVSLSNLMCTGDILNDQLIKTWMALKKMRVRTGKPRTNVNPQEILYEHESAWDLAA